MNRAQRRRVAKLNRQNAKKYTHSNTTQSPRAPKVQGMNVAFIRTLGDKIAFCKMLNAFRDEYFKGNSPFDVSPHYLDMVDADQGIHRNMFYWNDELIAISECSSGIAFGKPTLGVATVYVKPSWRGKGIANSIYNFVEDQLCVKLPGCIFNLHIEEEELVANSKKFIELGFTHAHHIAEFSNGMDYQQKTYAVIKGASIEGATPLTNFKA